MQKLCEFFGIERGVTALIGGGGKTSTMLALAEELRKSGSVIVCTSTHILRPERLPYRVRIEAPLKRGEVVSTGTPDGRKLTAPAQSFETLCALADYVLVEADGARQLPLKAHAPHEPVIPACANKVLAVVGIDGLCQPIGSVCHRPERYAALVHASTDTPVTAEMIRDVVMTYPRVDGVVINKADDAALLDAAKALAGLFSVPVAVTAWQSKDPILFYRRNEQ